MPEEKFTSKFFEDLRLLMDERFSLDELRMLCIYLDIDYDNLPGSTKNTKLREMIYEFDRTRRLADLIGYCRKERPNIVWPEPPQDVSIGADVNVLHKAMSKAFSVDELELLCADVEALLREDNIFDELDLDTVGGEAKPRIILNLINHLDRRNRLKYLVKAVRTARPEIL